ncbi:MAG: excinuclease ABC subunit UvrB [Candidatus Electryonea clarkiae]|nr:excinuclease ABC subunit UvrB [Candidatus Electryonea clarkiae]MDP8285986.1 excinuclease ABC subunit UvrB [Candidatus Electryonea clarkiae]
MADFELFSNFKPRGDQEQAIDKLVRGFNKGQDAQVLLGITGSGKTYTVANVIQQLGIPTLIMSHNKTLAAQLYGEFRQFFPNNAVEFFISYYDYYQPEAYITHTDTYVEKETSVNDQIERLRLRATSSLFEREDVIIVASVSSIYGLGSPQDYKDLCLYLEPGMKIERDQMLHRLVDIQYERTNTDLEHGSFRVRGDTVEILAAYEEDVYRIEMWGDEIERVSRVHKVTGDVIGSLKGVAVYPNSHYVAGLLRIEKAMALIKAEAEERVTEFRRQNKLVEAQRLEQRVKFDMEMLSEVGYCNGIENYSRHFAGKNEGDPPNTLFDYFPDDFLVVVDESHASVPQIGGMFNGDRSRKQNLVEFGFRLPSALDNRPLRFHEWEERARKLLFVSATPSQYELQRSSGVFVEQIIRPTGLLDPKVEIRPTNGQVDDLLNEIREQVERRERVLVTTLTKRMAENLSDYLRKLDVRVRYLHSEIHSLERIEILRDLRLGHFDVLVGINLLREGLDLPEVSLVAILDADKEGFLRSETSLMQTSGRAARNAAGRVIFYADNVTKSMKKVIDETNRRRVIQDEYNKKNGITPKTIRKTVEEILATTSAAAEGRRGTEEETLPEVTPSDLTAAEKEELIIRLEEKMFRHADSLEFEKAARVRDEIERIKGSHVPDEFSK